jgi:molybdate transport system substrate-binding protein
VFRSLLVVVCVASVFSQCAGEQRLHVSAAISLSPALRDIQKLYTGETGGKLEFNFAASNVLARQIVEGAPVDVFISADEAQMDYAQQRGGIDASTRIALLSNRLAVVTPAGRHHQLRDVQGLTDPAIRRIAIGDATAVPAGVYARQYLERVGLWQKLQPKLLPLANVRAALAAVESSGADAAFVYESDSVGASRSATAFVIDDANAPRIVYPAAVTAASTQADAARQFLAFLQGAASKRIFERYKFSTK